MHVKLNWILNFFHVKYIKINFLLYLILLGALFVENALSVMVGSKHRSLRLSMITIYLFHRFKQLKIVSVLSYMSVSFSYDCMTISSMTLQ